MKKLILLFTVSSAVTMHSSHAQPFWSGSSISTITTGNCTIGTDLSVGNSISLELPDPAGKEIKGNSVTGFVALRANTSNSDGATLELFGKSYSPFEGSMHYNSYLEAGGTMSYSGWAHMFQNLTHTTTSDTWTPLMAISKNGKVVISDVISSVPSEFLSVKESIGLISNTDGLKQINGNAEDGYLAIHTKTNNTDGATIELYGSNFTSGPGGDLRGRIHYNSFMDPNTSPNEWGHVFQTLIHTPTSDFWRNTMALNNTGRVVITDALPTSTPSDYLTVKDRIGFSSANATSERSLNGNAPSGFLAIHSNTSNKNGSVIEMYGPAFPSSGSDERSGRIHYNSYGYDGYGHIFQNYDPQSSSWNSYLAVQRNGKVVIGKDLINNGTTTTTTPGNYLLYVEKGILTEKIRVANHNDPGNWADYVFNEGYSLMPLQKVEAFVKKNKHLPGIPSASEVSKDGIDILEMDAQLLKKVEELTLYVIELQHQIDDFKKK